MLEHALQAMGNFLDHCRDQVSAALCTFALLTTDVWQVIEKVVKDGLVRVACTFIMDQVKKALGRSIVRNLDEHSKL